MSTCFGVVQVSGSRHAAICAVVGADAGAVALAARRSVRAHSSLGRDHRAAVRARLRLEAHPHLRHAQSRVSIYTLQPLNWNLRSTLCTWGSSHLSPFLSFLSFIGNKALCFLNEWMKYCLFAH